MVREMYDVVDEDDAVETVVEDDSDLDEGLNDLADLIETAGYEVPETIEDVEKFLDAVEQDVLEAGDGLDEKLGQKIKAAWHKAKKAVHGYMKKRRQNKAMRQSGKAMGHAFKKWDKAHPQHASADAPPADLEISEELDDGLHELADALEAAGYEILDDDIDVDEFLEGAEIALQDDSLDEKFGQKIKHALHKVRKFINKQKGPSFLKHKQYGVKDDTAKPAEPALAEKWKEVSYKGRRSPMGMPRKRKRKLA
jgi:hypothetical protein